MNLKSRKQNLSIQELKDELFVYDLNTDQVYSLNSTIAFVWNNLDGKTSVEELSLKIKESFEQPVNEDFVWLAIDELRKFNLLEEEGLPKAMSKLKRREVIKRIGLATMIALPMISMLVAPTALSAASGGGVALCQPCTGTTYTQANCAPGTVCHNRYEGGGKICTVNTSVGSSASPGTDVTDFGATNTAECNGVGRDLCCRGTATFSGGRCRCN